MARRGHKRKGSHRRRRSSHKGHVPLRLLESRLRRLNGVVKRRGGKHL